MTDRQIPGIHHVTAIAGDPQRNVAFYTDALGLRLVKLTVNFDDPGTYHLYYGDEQGHPGTILTFFPWPGARRGRPGMGQVGATSFLVPEGTLSYWEDRLQRLGATIGQRERRFHREVLPFLDPDSLQLELVADAAAADIEAWQDGPVPPERAIRGFYGATLWEKDPGPTVDLLTKTMGFELVAEEGSRSRFQAASHGPGAVVDVLHLSTGEPGWGGAGTVHHIAWRTPDDAQQMGWRRELLAGGFHVTPVMDRQYFRSIYYREPGGVLFEIATDPPGFLRDESPADLGSHLKLPPWLEPRRSEIEGALPKLRLSRMQQHEPA
jgi:glyoxalase family protein